MISDEQLRAAAELACAARVRQLTQGYDPENVHEFSPRFQRKMKKLIRRANHPIFYRTMQRAASILLAIFIAGSAWLAVDVEAREKFFGWVSEIWESYFIYRTDGPEGTDNNEPVDYRPTKLPDGYEESQVYLLSNNTLIIYTNDTENVLKFQYAIDSKQAYWGINTFGLTIKETKIGNIPARLFLSNDTAISNSLTWIGNDNTSFCISAFLSEDELIAIAESVQATKN